jgi:hypothetical protein
MLATRPLLTAICLSVSVGTWAAGIFKWTDDSGATHYSATPPVGRPAQALQRQRAYEEEQVRRERMLKRQAEEQQAADERSAQLRQACDELTRRLALLREQGRLFTRDSDGNVVWLSDEQRGTEIARAQELYEKHCQ